MTERHTADSITSDALDALYESLDAAQDTELYRQLATADAAFASATVRAAKAEAVIARVQKLLDSGPIGTCCDRLVRAALDQPAPAAGQAAEAEKTTRIFAALHRSAEQDVTRVINLYEQWVKAGPPPLGTQIARWWDKRLVELHKALLPTGDQAKEQQR